MIPEVMKALVKRVGKPGLWLEDVPVPQVGRSTEGDANIPSSLRYSAPKD